MRISKTDKRIQEINEINNICAGNNSSVMIYGATHTGRSIVRYMIENALKVPYIYVVDDEYITDEDTEKGIIPVSIYLRDFAEVSPLVFGFYNYEIIKEKRAKYNDVIPHMYDFHITVVNEVRVDWNYQFFKSNEAGFDYTYNLLADDRSKQTMECYLNAAISGEFDVLFDKYRDSKPYFYGILDEVTIDKLFDCGAYDGDSIHDYTEVYTGYKEIYAFEPDRSNIKKIKQRIESEKIHNITIIEKGVWSKTTTLHFSSEGTSASSVSDAGGTTIEVIRLDDMYDKFDADSLIKMDIEGSELEALKGAERIIREIHPVLAVCVYHKQEDLITIPQYISGLVDKGTYHYYLGYQGLDLAELVFYAVPNNKMNS